MEAFEGEGGGEVDGSGGFADSAFLVDDGDDLGGQGFGLWLGLGLGFIDGVDGDHRRKEKGIGRGD